ncbi:MAG: hypothetical protein FWE90_04755 [Defluviitaleaceae bacterium]|nr:hypothetical protein [Defluviitaleaceae bacterium]
MIKVKRIIFGCLLFALVVIYCPAVFGQVVLSYEQALELALEDLSAIHNLEIQINTHGSEIDRIRRVLQEFICEDEHTRENHRKQITNHEQHIRYLHLSGEIINANTERSLRNALVNISVTENHIKIAEARLVLQEENLRRVIIMHRFGLTSTQALQAAKRSVTERHMELDRLFLTEYDQRQALNHILQQPLYQMTRVEFTAELPELPEDLDLYIESLIPQTPAIRQTQINIETRREERDFFLRRNMTSAYRQSNVWRFSDDGLQYTWNELVNGYETAVRERDTAIHVMEANIRAAYNYITLLINQKAAGLSALEQAIYDLNSTHKLLELGRVTPFEVENARFSVLERELTLLNTYYQLWLAGLSLANQ